MKNDLFYIKCAGGKRQLLEQYKPYFPKKIDRYFDPFLGGGAIAFYIIQKYKPREVYLSDGNSRYCIQNQCLLFIPYDVMNPTKQTEQYACLYARQFLI